MAASTQDKDYVYLVANEIEKSKLCRKSDGILDDEVNAVALGYSVWEIQSNDRTETFNVLDSYLYTRQDLVTIQLDEKVHDTTTFEKDFEKLIRHIKDKCVDVQ